MIAARCLAVLLVLAGGRALAAPQPQAGASAPERHARAAQEAQRAGDFATAIRELTILSRLAPDRADVHSNLGLAYFFHRQPREALASFERALKLNPDLVSALIFGGIAHHQLSQPSRAAPLLERAVNLSPADPLAHTWLAHSYAAQGRFKEAADHFVIASERSPQDVDVWYGLGEAYVQLGRQEVERLAEAAPGGARVLQLAADLWLLRGERSNALQLYREALKKRPELTEVAQIVHRLEAAEQSPAQANVQPNARANTQANTQADAPLAPPRPAAGDPAIPEDAHYRAATDCRERAERAFAQIAVVGAQSHRAHQVLAESFAAQDRVAEALVEYRAAIALKPEIAGVSLAMGNLLMSEGRAAEALEAYRQEQRLRPDDPEVHYRIGRALIVVGQETEAEAALTRALASADAPPAARRELGKIQLNRGQPKAAIQTLSAYVKSIATDASAHYLLMRAYRALGDTASAARHLAEYTRLSDRDAQQGALQKALAMFSRERTTP